MGVASSHGSCFRDRQFGLFTSVNIYRKLKLTLYMQAKFMYTRQTWKKGMRAKEKKEVKKKKKKEREPLYMIASTFQASQS